MEKANRQLLAIQVEDELMNYIAQEPVGVGEKIPNEFDLAQMFGVGRSTIREAVKSLASQGVLEVRRGSGTFVVSMNKVEEDPLGFGRFEDKFQLALELFEVRLMLEPEIAALACSKATEEEKQCLKKLCDETENLYLAGKNHTGRDIEFHSCIAKCSKNRVIEILLPIIQSAIVTFVNLTQGLLMEETIRTHRAITDAILKGDSVGARCSMIMHLTYNRQMIVKMMQAESQEETKEI